MPFAYSDIDRLIIERWQDVVGLLEAQRKTQDRIDEMIGAVGDRLARWARPHGYEVETDHKNVEFLAHRTSWNDRRKGPKVQFALGGFCPAGYKKLEYRYPYLWVHTDGLARFKVKEDQRTAFAHRLREALGAEARSWEAPDVEDADHPLGRYLTDVSETDRIRFIASDDALFEFATEHFPTLFNLADLIETELARAGV